VFDLDAIVLAWNTGDPSELSEKNRRIFDKCVDVINFLITDDMDDFEIQLAIHDWIIGWSNYDPGALSNRPIGEPNPNNENPYGLLFDRVAICTGFSYTFQLFMNLLGFECITVHGYSFREKEHAWNLVKIGGEWFVVDVTWNNPVGGRLTYRHFNLTSQYLWDTIGHRWDRESVPEAYGRWPR
jgi:transglutaminase/protease-like cytokinesis protein 3